MPEALHFQIDEYYLDLQKQGQDMEIMDRAATQKNPFPGLRPFRTAEAHLFFGREGQAEALIGRLMQTHFLGVLGNSGSGKSSLVRAGLIPALHAGKKQDRVSDWKIVICRPGNSPVQNLAAALAGANLNATEDAVLRPEVQRLLPVLQESSFGLLEAEEGAGKDDKTLLIVDQFEELFRFDREIPAGEAAHFVDLLLTAVQQEGAHIYVVITMRSEFLGECVRYRGLPEIINEGQYLVPRLTGDNVRRAVAGPLGVVGAPVDATLVNRLVREVGDNMDQLPLLQHALMRTYRRWQQQDGDTPISHEDYEAVGCMGEALGRHADEHFQELDATGRAVAKLLFQRLTDLSAGDKGGRRPTLMAEIYGLAQALPADRYHAGGAPHAHDWQAEQELYERNIAFLQACQTAETDRAAAHEAEIAEKARVKQRVLYRNVITGIILVALALTGWLFYQSQQNLAKLEEAMQEVRRLESQEKLREAKVYLEAGQYLFAIKALEEALQKDSSNREASDSLRVYQETMPPSQ